MSAELRIPKKLIEVALPLDAINAAAAREKSIRHGHPNTLHLWWARRPLAAARAVIFAQMVNDPGYERHLGRGVNKADALKERERLFGIIERLVRWENSNNQQVLQEARDEILRSWRETCALNKDHPCANELFNPDHLPALHDPFAGGGAIPLEAQRLGLEAFASDLNPVAVTINKAMIEIPARFAGSNPVGPLPESDEDGKLFSDSSGNRGLVEDVRRFGLWIKEEAIRRIGSFYPPVEITPSMAKNRPDLKPFVGQSLPVIAWIWARTVRSPNPAYSHVHVPLVASFHLSKKTGKGVWVEPKVDKKSGSYKFTVHTEGEPKIEQTVNRRGGVCIMSGTPIDFPYIREQGKAGRLGQKLMAVALEGPRGRIYIDPTDIIESVAKSAAPKFRPETSLPAKALGFRVQEYGMTRHSDLFTSRQLLLLTTLSDLIAECREKVRTTAVAAGWSDDGKRLDEGGTGASAYADAVSVYLALFVSRQANYSSTLCVWSSHPKDELVKQVFLRHALAMTWDFAESNPFGDAGGSLSTNLSFLCKAIPQADRVRQGHAFRSDATDTDLGGKIIITDPPYFDNVGYADLSDFFYIWLRRSLKEILPNLFQLELVPKKEELIASPFRHETWEQAEGFFLDGIRRVMQRAIHQGHPAFPVSIFYAFKQSETDNEDQTSNTGWDTFLQALCDSGYAIVGTWPMRTELTGNLKKNVNALASSVVLVARERSKLAPTISRREFLRELNAALPDALAEMTAGSEHSPVAPVDLSQAIIGPGMAIFSKYSAVLEADGRPMTVRTALQLINKFLAEDDFDNDTQFCLQWFEGHGWDKAGFGEADVLARAKGTSVEGLQEGGVAESGSGSVRLLRPNELSADWSPETDTRMSVWEILHHLVRIFGAHGEVGAGEVLARTNRFSEAVRTLAYRLYTLCERKGWAQEAGQYNALVIAWEAIEKAAQAAGISGTQTNLFEDDRSARKPEEKLKRTRKTKS